MPFAKFLEVSVNPTIDTDAYTSGDVVGGLLTFDVSKFVVNGGILNNVILVDEDGVEGAFDLWLFNAVPTTIADDAAFAPTIADGLLVRYIASISTYTTENNFSIAIVEDINQTIYATGGKIYGYLVAGGAHNFTTADGLTIITSWVSEQ